MSTARVRVDRVDIQLYRCPADVRRLLYRCPRRPGAVQEPVSFIELPTLLATSRLMQPETKSYPRPAFGVQRGRGTEGGSAMRPAAAQVNVEISQKNTAANKAEEGTVISHAATMVMRWRRRTNFRCRALDQER